MVPSDVKKTVDEQLESIVQHLQRMDRRDRLRTWGGFVRSIIGLIPLAISLFTLWYLYQYGDQVLRDIFEEASKQTTKQLQQFLPR